MDPLRVRGADHSDAAEISRLLGQLGYPVEVEATPERIERMSRGGRAVVLLATDGTGTIGVATAHILSVLNRARDVAWLTALVVDEAVRGRGVGRALVSAVEAFARESDCVRLSVTTYLDRTDAHAFYARIGFELTGRRYGKPLAPLDDPANVRTRSHTQPPRARGV